MGLVGDKCQDACNVCDDDDQEDDDQEIPTIPEDPPIRKTCKDDPFFTFGSFEWENQNGEKKVTIRTCSWLTENNSATRIATWCDETVAFGVLVGDKCQDACNVCDDDLLSIPNPGTCKDSPFNWMDLEGNDCAFYEQGNNCNEVAGRDAQFGKTASEACCGCGGGCYDLRVNGDEAWYDGGGSTFDCSWYEAGPDRCAMYGARFENFGKVANEACCVCGGGSSNDDSRRHHRRRRIQ